jgi:hypothetical protein
MIWIFSALSDQGFPLDWAKKAVIATKNVELESLTVVNKGASACVIQLFNLPFDPAVVGAPTIASNICTLANHGLQTGDNVTLTGGTSGTATGYVAKLDANRFSLYDTLANARTADGSTGLTSLASVVGTVSTVWNSGTVIQNGTDYALLCEEYPLLGTSGSPSNQMSFTAAKFTRGLFVRGVTALNGSTLIGSSDLKFTPRFRIGPVQG